jgi:hypothetical protein
MGTAVEEKIEDPEGLKEDPRVEAGTAEESAKDAVKMAAKNPGESG